MRKICFVIQRYGKEVVGGSEDYCRQIAERLTPYFEVEVLTSKAIEYDRWDNKYGSDVELINGVTVRRFDTTITRSVDPKCLHDASTPQASLEAGEAWLRAQGPYCPGLPKYLVENLDNYDAVIAVTYLYYPAYAAAKAAGKKTILIPTAHDEPPLYFPIYRELFANSAAWYFLTPEEKEFVKSVFPSEGKILSSGNGGVGINLPKEINERAFRDKYGIGETPYLLYAGRVNPMKGFPRLFDYMRKFKERNGGDLKLVIIGSQDISVPEDDDIVYLGFVPREDKYAAMKGALALVQPSANESLSIVVLESLCVGTPVLVNGHCEVLRGHCIRSNAGFYFYNYIEFEESLRFLQNNSYLTQQMSINGSDYVGKNYVWDLILTELKEIIERVISNNRT